MNATNQQSHGERNAPAKQVRFHELAKTYTPGLYHYAWWLTRDHALSEDLIQETLFRAWQSLDSLRDETAIQKWLTTILRNEFFREIRRHRKEVSIDAVGNTLEDMNTELSPSDMERLEMHDLLSKLPQPYLEPLVLQVIMGYSTQEIAQILELSQAGVLTRLFRARRMLRDALLEIDTKATLKPPVQHAPLTSLDRIANW